MPRGTKDSPPVPTPVSSGVAAGGRDGGCTSRTGPAAQSRAGRARWGVHIADRTRRAKPCGQKRSERALGAADRLGRNHGRVRALGEPHAGDLVVVLLPPGARAAEDEGGADQGPVPDAEDCDRGDRDADRDQDRCPGVARAVDQLGRLGDASRSSDVEDRGVEGQREHEDGERRGEEAVADVAIGAGSVHAGAIIWRRADRSPSPRRAAPGRRAN